MSARTALHGIDGYLVVLPHVRNVYPVSETNAGGMWEWGFKYTDGFYENFVRRSAPEAEEERDSFVAALNDYWG